jgi:hypothetical protein
VVWRVAKCLLRLREQVNQKCPNRTKVSDGTIGDPRHAARVSDHNPNSAGIVCALDITNDPIHGLITRELAQVLLDTRDPRIKYVISNGEIASGASGDQPWIWRPYSGSNPHTAHVHVSVEGEVDSEALWDLSKLVIKPDLVVKPPQDPKPPVLSKGAKGLWVQKLQERLKLRGYTLAVDSVFGPRTLHIVKLFQRSNKLVVDGIVGPHTWTALLKPVKPKPKPKPKKRSTPKVRRSVPKGRRKRGKTNDVAPSA